MSRVLVVEDEAHLAQGLRFNLEAEGHSVTVDADGESALRRLLADEEQFDAIVLDVMLPGKDGFAVASELREARVYTPILMLTARGRPEDVLQGFAAGADDYDRVTRWLAASGFEIVRTSPARTTVTVRGSARAAQQAFGTELHGNTDRVARILDRIVQDIRNRCAQFFGITEDAGSGTIDAFLVTQDFGR